MRAHARSLETRLAAANEKVADRDEDARRYRWLRDRPSFIGWDWWQPPVPQETWIDGDFMDKAIDAMLPASPPKAGEK